MKSPIILKGSIHADHNTQETSEPKTTIEEIEYITCIHVLSITIMFLGGFYIRTKDEAL